MCAGTHADSIGENPYASLFQVVRKLQGQTLHDCMIIDYMLYIITCMINIGIIPMERFTRFHNR